MNVINNILGKDRWSKDDAVSDALTRGAAYTKSVQAPIQQPEQFRPITSSRGGPRVDQNNYTAVPTLVVGSRVTSPQIQGYVNKFKTVVYANPSHPGFQRDYIRNIGTPSPQSQFNQQLQNANLNNISNIRPLNVQQNTSLMNRKEELFNQGLRGATLNNISSLKPSNVYQNTSLMNRREELLGNRYISPEENASILNRKENQFNNALKTTTLNNISSLKPMNVYQNTSLMNRRDRLLYPENYAYGQRTLSREQANKIYGKKLMI